MSELPQSLVLCTCPDQETARKLADQLVAERLAACVNIVPGLESVYEWQGKVERDAEVLLIIKTREDHYARVEKTIQQHHPYELPEILRVSLDGGLQDYLQWIDNALE
ncbi:divalent-cation tolerance protein CutA [Thiohalophilus thiocyanatoxydans]|uniref:Periplasmic divalent cation tolerance protein n=1 Tax=Thiohalophilus thiocyanatoxydans TaxID=381308 RepID=A0A4R8IG94_9GAMM|nr:divalent-cation tolerance protein CutA [Thiohalophilus thiocyanatoxydans]TDX99585.1 periplasmic divalent cation tolerance protein [Thiohalophilus thiocyanatoxydans]